MAEHDKTIPSGIIRIDHLPAGGAGGRIGLTLAPGKSGFSSFGGMHARDLAADLDEVAAWNAAAVVTLIEPSEFELLNIPRLGEEVRARFMEWHHLPIPDVSVPGLDFERAWPVASARLRGLLDTGCRVLVHCRGGLGRAGLVAARLLVEMGMEPKAAVATVRNARKGAIETAEQERWVLRGTTQPVAQPDTSPDAIRDRAVGALLGLAVGDAVGTTLEFEPKPRRAVLDDMVGGGPFRLKPGEWTDDTSMAIALAESLLAYPGLDAADLMNRFVDWRSNGTYSATGTCFDIGNTVSAALRRYERTGDPVAGSSDPNQAGNGALMRVSPVAIRHWGHREELLRVAALQTRTTHGAPATMNASAVLVEMLADAISGRSLADILSGQAAGRIEGRWRGCHRDDIEGTGYVVDTLRAAVWATSRTTSFKSAVLLASNLGDDADTVAAVTGQLAGAIYGLSGIPSDWLGKLAWRERLEAQGAALFASSRGGAP